MNARFSSSESAAFLFEYFQCCINIEHWSDVAFGIFGRLVERFLTEFVPNKAFQSTVLSLDKLSNSMRPALPEHDNIGYVAVHHCRLSGMGTMRMVV